MSKEIKHYSLALWWWASRWFAHIWVLKYLEEKGIKIDELAWTSMWAIITSLTAIWKNWNEILEIFKQINYIKLLDLNLWYGGIAGKKLLKKFEEVFENIKIEDTKIPLKIIATNIETGERKIFENWKIIEALRASVSLPWIFSPHKIWEEYFVDGGVVNNLPVDVLKWENIIWVSALKNLQRKLKTKRKIAWINMNITRLEYHYEVLHKAILFMMKQNEDKSIENLDWKNAIIIRPNFWKLDYYSFDKIDEFVELGYLEAKNAFEKI